MTDRRESAYKVVEVAPVTEESLEAALNARAAEGWSFDSLHFVMREGSHRPSMAYLFFTLAADRRHGAEAEPVRSGSAGGPGGPKATPAG